MLEPLTRRDGSDRWTPTSVLTTARSSSSRYIIGVHSPGQDSEQFPETGLATLVVSLGVCSLVVLPRIRSPEAHMEPFCPWSRTL